MADRIVRNHGAIENVQTGVAAFKKAEADCNGIPTPLAEIPFLPAAFVFRVLRKNGAVPLVGCGFPAFFHGRGWSNGKFYGIITRQPARSAVGRPADSRRVRRQALWYNHPDPISCVFYNRYIGSMVA